MNKTMPPYIQLETDSALPNAEFAYHVRPQTEREPPDFLSARASLAAACLTITLAILVIANWAAGPADPSFQTFTASGADVLVATHAGLLGAFVLLWHMPPFKFSAYALAATAAGAVATTVALSVGSGGGGIFADTAIGNMIATGAVAVPGAALANLVAPILLLTAALVALASKFAAAVRTLSCLCIFAVLGTFLLARLYNVGHSFHPVEAEAIFLPTLVMQTLLAVALLFAGSGVAGASTRADFPLFTHLTWRTLFYVAPLSVLAGALASRGIAEGLISAATAIAATIVVTFLLLIVVLARNMHELGLRTRQRDDALFELRQSETRLRIAQSAADIALIDWDIAADHAVWSSNFPGVFDIKDDLATNKTPYEVFIGLVHPDDRARVDALHLKLLQSGGRFSDEFRVQTASGQTRWIASRGGVVLDKNGTARRLISSNFNVTERRQTEERLQHGFDMLEFANEAGEIGVWSSDLSTRTGRLDDRARSIFGLQTSPSDVSFAAFLAIVHGEDLKQVRADLVAAVKSGEKFSLECRICAAAGTVRWVRIRGKSELDPVSRRSLRLTGIVFDITERREKEAHLHFLLREITHRSKNLLAVIQSMARQTGSISGSMADFQTRFTARLQGLSASHDLLVNTNWQGADIAEIIKSQIGAFGYLLGSRVSLHGPKQQLKPEAAQNIGLAVHELLTNAAKYGALSNAVGTVKVSWYRLDSDTRGERFKVLWEETGGPTVQPQAQRGFGSTITERVVARALDGSVELSFQPEGVCWTLDIPANHVLATVQ